MATRYVTRIPTGAAQYTGSHAGFAVDSDTDLLQLNADGTVRPIGSKFTRIITESTTLTPAESGTTLIADLTTDIIVTLPATQAGLEYTLIVGQVTGGTEVGHAFSPNANDKIIGGGLSPADDKDVRCSRASDVAGDLLTVVGDGSLGWYIKRKIGTWARE